MPIQCGLPNFLQALQSGSFSKSGIWKHRFALTRFQHMMKPTISNNDFAIGSRWCNQETKNLWITICVTMINHVYSNQQSCDNWFVVAASPRSWQAKGGARYGMVWHGSETICKVKAVRLANALGIHDSSLPLAILFRSGSSSQVRNRLLLVDIQSESQRAQHEPAWACVLCGLQSLISQVFKKNSMQWYNQWRILMICMGPKLLCLKWGSESDTSVFWWSLHLRNTHFYQFWSMAC